MKQSQDAPAPESNAVAYLQVIITRRKGQWVVACAHVTTGQSLPTLLDKSGSKDTMIAVIDATVGKDQTEALQLLNRKLHGLRKKAPGRFQLLKAAARMS